MFSQLCDFNFSTKLSRISSQNSHGLDFQDGRQKVRRPTSESCQLPAMIAHDRYGGGSVMVWGGITMTGRTELYICQGNVAGLYYRDNVIEPVVPHARLHGNAVIFQDDNARAHRARVVQDHLQFRSITTLPWPSAVPRPVPNWAFVEHSRETCLRTVLQATGHQRTRWCTPGGLCPDSPKQPLGGSSGAWGVVVSLPMRRMEVQHAIETSVKLIYWPLLNSKSSSHAIH